ncbi:SoxR reducing system RseC family protein [Pseudomonadota bacterium]
MIEQQGKVVGINDGLIQVRLGGMNGCSRCDSGKGCGAGVFGRMLRREPVVLELENDIDASNGEAVIVGINEEVYLRLVVRLYLLPLLAGLAGAALAYYLARLAEVGPIGIDAISLLGGIVSGAAVAVRNRYFSIEFPGPGIVHLLRVN